MKRLVIVISLILLISKLYSQSEIIVNTYQDSTQSQPVIQKIDTEENFVVVWKSENQSNTDSEGDIYLRYFSSDLSPIGDEVLVNDFSNGPQENPQIASNGDGDFVIVWSTFDRNDPQKFFDVKARLHSNMIRTAEFTVNSNLNFSQIRPSVSMNKDGKFIIVWESWFQDGSDRGVYAQIFNSGGNKIGYEFIVNTTTQYSQCRPVVKYFDDGKFIIVWESWNESELGYNLFAKIYDPNGNVLKDEFMVNSYTDNYQWMADVSTYEDNSFDIVWCSWEQDGFDGGIFLRSFNNNYEPLSEEIQVNSSTEYYQWLPKIQKFNDGKKAIVWSSWNLDGSREGVYYKVLSEKNREIALEKRINENTESYQWEPDLLTLSSDEIICTWSSWGEVGKDYEIMIKKIKPDFLIGMIDENSYIHTEGNSTSNFIVHVVDSVKLNGHEYEISFSEYGEDNLAFSIEDITASSIKVNNYPLNQGKNVQYLTDEFDGVMVEIIPNFDLDIDLAHSTFINNSGTNITFTLAKPVIYPTIAPLDVVLIWGNPDTLTDGKFVEPLDTALSPSNVREIEMPFYAETIGENEKLGAVVFENPATQNKRWDPGEDVVFLTPKEFKTNAFSTHVQLFSSIESEEIIWPNIGDTNYVVTIKPITTEDVYQFTTFTKDIILDLKNHIIADNYQLLQNYPNPFNPLTIIDYIIPATSGRTSELSQQKVTLKVYDILGREIKTLVNSRQAPGNYSIEFNGSGFSSGVYFYKLNAGNVNIVKKMLMIK